MPSPRALTTTPSILPSSGELTTPVSAAPPWAATGLPAIENAAATRNSVAPTNAIRCFIDTPLSREVFRVCCRKSIGFLQEPHPCGGLQAREPSQPPGAVPELVDRHADKI